jgi:outer membrane protein, heavy metal efflux system
MRLKFVWVLVPLLLGFWIPGIHAAGQPAESSEPPPTLRLSLHEAVALFLQQNFDLFITKYGIDHAKGEQITARLFPNPEFAVGGASAFTQGQTLRSTGLIMPSIQQLFEVAGKRGYRIESARYGVRSAEAQFEDAVRQLTFTVQDTYFRVQLAQKRQELAQENRDRFRRILAVNTVRFEKGFIAEVDLIRIRLQIVDFHAQVIQEIQEANRARADLRFLLGISPANPLVLTTELTFNRIDPDLPRLQALALESRPDIQARQMARSQRMAEQKLARAFRYPDITVGGSYGIQGPQGPDLQQQWGLSLGFPLPLFNRNQGGLCRQTLGFRPLKRNYKKPCCRLPMRWRWPTAIWWKAGIWLRPIMRGFWRMPVSRWALSSGRMSREGLRYWICLMRPEPLERFNRIIWMPCINTSATCFFWIVPSGERQSHEGPSILDHGAGRGTAS